MRQSALQGFLRRRIDKETFIGLPLTILAALFALDLIVFGNVVEDVLKADPIVTLDIRIDALLAANRQPALTGLFLWITLLGKGQVIGVMALTTAALFLLWGRRHLVVPLALTLIGAEAAMQLAKRIVGRVRPSADLAYYVERSFSFPSGHATIAAAFYGFLAYALTRDVPTRGQRAGVVCGLLAVIAGVGLSRMYLGVHFLSDVLGGYLMGGLWLIIGVAVAEIFRSPSPATLDIRQLAVPMRLALSTALIAVTMAFYLIVAWHYVPSMMPISAPAARLLTPTE